MALGRGRSGDRAGMGGIFAVFGVPGDLLGTGKWAEEEEDDDDSYIDVGRV